MHIIIFTSAHKLISKVLNFVLCIGNGIRCSVFFVICSIAIYFLEITQKKLIKLRFIPCFISLSHSHALPSIVTQWLMAVRLYTFYISPIIWTTPFAIYCLAHPQSYTRTPTRIYNSQIGRTGDRGLWIGLQYNLAHMIHAHAHGQHIQLEKCKSIQWSINNTIRKFKIRLHLSAVMY